MDREGNYALITCLPPLVGGRGTTKWWRGAAESGLIKLAAKPPPQPSEPGPRSGPSSCPLPSRCARHPPPGRGWAGNMEERNVASNPAYPILWGERRPRPYHLPPTARRGEGDHEVVEGGRRLAVRTAMEHPIDALPRTPFPASRDFPSRGNERYEGKNSESYTSRTFSVFSLFGGCRHHLARWEACHMTQKVNPVTLLASPLGEEGHEVAKGWTVVILIMILDVDVTAEGGLIKLAAKPPPPSA